MNERELPLTALRAFVVAANSPTLATAARQLGVTHGAVSKQIGVLEAWLGQSLFVRQGRTLQLTPYGIILSEKVAGSIRQIGEACDYVRRDRSRRVIAVEAPTTFAMYFLLPRIKEFEARYANLSVWIATRLTGQMADFSRHDVVVSRGPLSKGSTRAAAEDRLFEEKLTPVSAISLLRERPIKRPADLQSHRLIASSSRPGHWEAWLEHADLGVPFIEGGHRFDHLHVALHAVRDGLGSTIAPLQFFDGISKQYRLRCPLPDVVVQGETYFVCSSRTSETEHVERFIGWLHEQCLEGNGR